MNSGKMLYQISSLKGSNLLTSVSTLSLTSPGNDDSLDDYYICWAEDGLLHVYCPLQIRHLDLDIHCTTMQRHVDLGSNSSLFLWPFNTFFFCYYAVVSGWSCGKPTLHQKHSVYFGTQQIGLGTRPRILTKLRDLSEISRGGGGGGNFKFGLGNEVTHRCNGSEIC